MREERENEEVACVQHVIQVQTGMIRQKLGNLVAATMRGGKDVVVSEEIAAETQEASEESACKRLPSETKGRNLTPTPPRPRGGGPETTPIAAADHSHVDGTVDNLDRDGSTQDKERRSNHAEVEAKVDQFVVEGVGGVSIQIHGVVVAATMLLTYQQLHESGSTLLLHLLRQTGQLLPPLLHGSNVSEQSLHDRTLAAPSGLMGTVQILLRGS
ncbi:hypothetical protein K435DRAFT_875704 [Dendrothele bispora CBS 962.96]|uniref:Uncharacterized protein n=1 Tax=Dendrothele bispora (strain CBS 962.96) TaxID=1314807 RepID=A0A4S8KTQ7_DENBC|nr:hypothetical protein K435DRAFT_875704 [Dendrothele bispora CBS 962.96]